jgi:hypothetical protein
MNSNHRKTASKPPVCKPAAVEGSSRRAIAEAAALELIRTSPTLSVRDIAKRVGLLQWQVQSLQLRHFTSRAP